MYGWILSFNAAVAAVGSGKGHVGRSDGDAVFKDARDCISRSAAVYKRTAAPPQPEMTDFIRGRRVGG